MSRVLVIAEPGCTAEGQYSSYVRLIQAAHQAGADVFKAQWTSNPERMCERRNIGLDHPKRVYYLRAYGWISFPLEWHVDFSRLCGELGMQYACTSYLPEDVATVDPWVRLHKVSSFESQDDALLAAAEGTRKRVVVSAGMNDGDWHHLWYGNDVLHCTSSYPAPLDAVNLAVIRRDHHGDRLGNGLSDHSRNLLTGAVAVGAGAEIIEIHFRLDDCSPANPDYAVSFNPREFAEYVKNVRTAETLMGDGVKRVQDCEREMMRFRVKA